VPVDGAGRVDGREGACDLEREIAQEDLGEWGALVQEIAERPSGDELHHEEVEPPARELAPARLERAHDRRVEERAPEERLAREALRERRLRGEELRAEHLERDRRPARSVRAGLLEPPPA